MNANLAPTDTVRAYLREIGRIPMLTHEQEILYGNQVQLFVDLIGVKNILSKELGREPNITEWAMAANLEPLLLQKTIASGEKAKRRTESGCMSIFDFVNILNDLCTRSPRMTDPIYLLYF